MSVYMIATIRATKDKILALRLYDENSGQIRDMPLESVVNNLMMNYNIENLALHNGQIKGTNGNIDRYSIIPYGYNQSNTKPLVILGKDNDADYYLAVDYNGKQYEFSGKSIRNLNRPDMGVANGKIVNDRIFSIEGSYPEYRSSVSKLYKRNIAKLNMSNHNKEVYSKIIMIIAQQLAKNQFILVGKPVNKSKDLHFGASIQLGIRGRAINNSHSLDIYLGYPGYVDSYDKLKETDHVKLYVSIDGRLIVADSDFAEHFFKESLTKEMIGDTIKNILDTTVKYMKSCR